ncbi:MAG: ABC transporter ATP-binding protein [Phycisphaerales bacterium]|nr:ABC transporter ATP-binding protein [Phycisphaerales bacterium]
MLSVHSVSKRFGGLQAVLNVSFDLRRGEVVGLLGPNGAGKTTTIRMISGYVPPDSGRVEVDGHDTLSDSLAARRALGYLPESAPLYGEMKTADYLDYRGRLFGMPRAARRAAIDRVIGRCWLGDVRRRRVGELSKGYKQRVGLAAAMLHGPGLLILDEPTNGLDPTQIRETRALIRELGREHSVLLSSHVLPEVEMTCDRVIVLARGEVRADERLAELVARHGSAEVIIEVSDPPGGPEGARRVLAGAAGVAGVARVERDGQQPGEAGWSRWRVAVETANGSGRDLREPLARAAASAGLVVRELRREAVSLERLFASMIVSQPGDDERTTVHPAADPAEGRR